MTIRRIILLAAGVSGTLHVCAAQVPVTVGSVTSISGPTAANIFAVDVNGDGLTDLIQDSGVSQSGFTVSINNGDGSFKAPVVYNVPNYASGSAQYTSPSIAAADFNNDGKIDLAVVPDGSDQIDIYLGNGDGTFQAPRISTISLAGNNFLFSQLAAADFNKDGNVDLVAWAGNSQNTTVYVVHGNGDGTFNASPTAAFTGTVLQPGFQIVVGDFDSDGNADIAALDSVEGSIGNTVSSTIHVLYGNGNYGFDVTSPYTSQGNLNIGAGDINSDGFTDLFAVGNGQLGVFLGNSSRTFDSYFMNLPGNTVTGTEGGSWENNPQLTMADFNGDGNMDLAAIAWSSDYTASFMQFFLSNGQPGQFTSQLAPLPATYNAETAPSAGLFSGNMLTPDAALNQSPNYGSPPQNVPSYIVSELNRADSGWFGPCTYPRSGEGFNVCQAGTASGTRAVFSTAVNSYGKLRKIELWVDGKKVSEQHHTWDTHAYFDWGGTFAAGTHQAAFFAVDVDNRMQMHTFLFTIQ